jgi:nicotinamide riboside transporter PnuC
MKAPFTDAIQGTLNISAIYLLGRRKTEGQLAFVVSNIFALIMFLTVGQIVMFFSTLSFELVSLLA